MRWRQLLNDIVHPNQSALIIILHCSLQSTASQLHNFIINELIVLVQQDMLAHAHPDGTSGNSLWC